jgi:hypothetical protein
MTRHRFRSQYEDLLDEYPLPVSESNGHEEFLLAIAYVLWRGDNEAAVAYDQQFPSTASGRALERHAGEVGLTRRPNESDAQLRWRTEVEHAVAASQGTTDSLLDVIQAMFGEAALRGTQLSSDGSVPILDVTIGNVGRVISEGQAQTIENTLERAVPIPFGVSVTFDGTFAFTEGEGDGFDEGTFGGDPLREDAVDIGVIPDATPAPRTIVDGFEDDDISEYGGDTGQFRTVDTTVFDGTYALEGSTGGGGFFIYSDGSLDTTPSRGDRYRVTTQLLDSANQSQLWFGVQSTPSSGQTSDGYVARLNGKQDKLQLLRRENSNTSSLSSTSMTVEADEWYDILVEYGDPIRTVVYDEAGTQIAATSVSDDTFDRGRIGFGINNGNGNASDVWYDYARII